MSEKLKKPPVSHKPSYVAQVLYECRGIVPMAAAKLMMDPQTVRKYINKYPQCKEARMEGIKTFQDIAENNLYDLLQAKDRTATLFVLKTIGADTWGEREAKSEDIEEPLELE